MPLGRNAPIGSLFGGFAQGMESGMKLDMQGQETALKMEELKQKRAEGEQKRAAALLAKYKDMFEPLREVFTNHEQYDDATRNAIVHSVSEEYKGLTGNKLHPTFVSALKKSPEDFGRAMENATAQGISPEVFFEIVNDPVMFRYATVAMGQSKRERDQRRLRGDGGGSATTTPVPSAQQPGGSGLRVEGMQAPVAFPQTASPAGAPSQPSGVLGQLEDKRAALEAKINALAGSGADEKVIKPFRDIALELDKQIFQLRSTGPVERSKQDEQPASLDELREAAARGVSVRVGMTRSELRGAANPQASTGGPTPTTSQPGVRTPYQVTSDTERAQRRERPLSDDLKRDPSVQKLGITTQGQYDDAFAKGTLTVQTPEERTRQDARARSDEESAGKQLTKIREDYSNSHRRKQALIALQTLHDQVGPTGAIVGPLRQQFFNVAQMLGAKPSTLDAQQIMETANLTLSIDDLKDFTGNDSDRDVMNAIRKNPGIMKTITANKVLTTLALDEHQRKEDLTLNANRWHGRFGSLAAKDPTTGQTFNEAWDEYRTMSAPVISDQLRTTFGLDSAKKQKSRGQAVQRPSPAYVNPRDAR